MITERTQPRQITRFILQVAKSGTSWFSDYELNSQGEKLVGCDGPSLERDQDEKSKEAWSSEEIQQLNVK